MDHSIFLKSSIITLNLMGINHEYIERETPEENGDIESFHNSIKTDYIWINEINNFNDGKIIIENAFYDYNNIRPHSTLDYYSPLQFLDKWNNDSNFREYYRLFLKTPMRIAGIPNLFFFNIIQYPVEFVFQA